MLTRDSIDQPFLSADYPGVRGVIKRYDEDFVVEEIPRYSTSGEGTHIYFEIEKRGLTTRRAIEMIARSLNKKPRDIGYAGLKDAHGVTRQMLSVEHIEPSRVESLDLNRIQILSVTRHTNKIKLGHLSGNRFVIKIRDTIDLPIQKAKPIFEMLIARGVPNYFGPQRFGVRGDNAQIGKAVLADDYDKAISLMLGRPGEMDSGDAKKARELFDAGDLKTSAEVWQKGFRDQAKLCRAVMNENGNARKAWRTVHHSMRKFYVSAFQSALFNKVLAYRLAGIDKLHVGDIAWKHRNGASFLVEDVEVEQLRCDAFEISATGPIFGSHMSEPLGQAAKVEENVLQESGLSRDQVRAKDGSKLDGARRPLRVPLKDALIEEGKDDNGCYLQLSFMLPPGAYATCVTREICK